MKCLIGSTSSHFPESAVAAAGRSGSASVLTGSKRGRGTGATALVAIVFGLMISLITVPVAFADGCPNSIVREQTGSTGLPDCRAYEMVSPPYKQGFPITAPIRFTDDGVMSFRSLGVFAGNAMAGPANLYHARRSAVGWVTSSLDPPGSIYETSAGANATGVIDESSDLRWSLWRMYRRDSASPVLGFWLRGPDGVFTRVGDGVFTSGGSAGDLSHVIVGTSEYVRTGSAWLVRPVAVDNDGLSVANCLREISPDGRVIVFARGCDGGVDSQLWARVGGSASVEVSGSECTREADDVGGLCNGASPVVYGGGALDGSRLFFTTTRQLVNGDVDQTSDLYACDIPDGVPVPVGVSNPCDALTEVSGAASGARVENVVSVSEDGSRVYFVAQGVLADNLDVSGVGALAGAENLYVWQRDSGHPAGQTRYVARLRDGNDLTRAQMTPDGRYLLLVTTNKLTSDDTDDAKDAYRYDAVTHVIVRVSSSVAGGGGNTHNPGSDVSIPAEPAVSADGSTVIFDTAEALSLSDVNGVDDVYSWRDGQVSLISAGGGNAVGVTPSGRDLFFRTAAQVLGADGDANADLYDARLGGGFAPAQAPPPCSGDQCQSLRSRPPSLSGPPVVGSGGGVAEVLPVFLVQAVSPAQRRAAARTGVLSIRVKSNSAGRFTAIANAKFKGRNRRVAFTSPIAKKAGTVKIRLSLSGAARQWLRSGRPLRVKLSVIKKGAKKRSMSVRLPGASS